jgi:hypothetical protein
MTKAVALILAVLAQSSQLSQGPAHAPDGGTRQILTSIFVPALPNAPFTANVDTEWTQFLDDGSTRVIKNHRLIVRDGLGRVFQERRTFGPDGSPMQSQLTSTELSEPATHTIAYCNARTRVCELRFYGATTSAPLQPARLSPNGSGSLVRENLGTRTLNGLDLVGTRETQTISSAAAGSDRPLVVVKEFWYSQLLGLNVLTKRVDPRSGTELFTVTDIRQAEPDQRLFTMPTDARVVDLRPTAAPRSPQ